MTRANALGYPWQPSCVVKCKRWVKRLSRVLLLLLLGGAAGALALEDLLTVLVELELGDDDLGGGDGDGDRLAVRLLADNCRGG
jgi:hypothetical protein